MGPTPYFPQVEGLISLGFPGRDCESVEVGFADGVGGISPARPDFHVAACDDAGLLPELALGQGVHSGHEPG